MIHELQIQSLYLGRVKLCLQNEWSSVIAVDVYYGNDQIIEFPISHLSMLLKSVAANKLFQTLQSQWWQSDKLFLNLWTCDHKVYSVSKSKEN